MSNSHRNRPELQARRLADMSNPEWQRRRAMFKAAKGKSRKRVADWNVAWNLAGRPRDFPDFPEWMAAMADQWAAEEAAARALQRRLNRYHAAWVAAGMPRGFPAMPDWEAAQVKR